jgi:O-antigen biosynthesis protein
MGTSPLFSVVTPVYAPPVEVLRETIRSVLEQTFLDWELVLVDDASPDPAVGRVLDEAAAGDPRVRLVRLAENSGIVAASNAGIDAARGELLALLDHDDLLAPTALEQVARVAAEHDDLDYLYSDEDKVDVDGHRYDLFLKPEWSPERLRGQMYTGHLSVLRTSLVRALGGFRTGFDGSQDHDLVLRVTERARRIVHLPEVLYHWRAVQGSTADDPGAKPYTWEAGRRAVEEHLQRRGIAGRAELGPVPGTYRVRRPAPPGRVSVIVPTRGSTGMVFGERRCFVVEAVQSIVAHSGLDDLEVVVVYDPPTPPEVLDRLREVGGDHLRLVLFDEPFNFSAKCNVGAVHATGEFLLFLNDDTELPAGDGLADAVGLLAEPDVGMAGVRLLFEDGRLQHGGHVYHEGDWFHARFFAGPDDTGPFAALLIARETSGLTAACVAMRREVFQEVGGFDEQLPLNFNDVDLSYKVRSAGYRLVWVPQVTLSHFESQTRVPTVLASEIHTTRQRWGVPGRDLYFPQESRV